MKVLGLLKTSVGAPWAVRQTRDLVKLGVDVHVALPPDGPRVPEYKKVGVTVHPLQPDFPIREPWRFPALRRELRTLVAQVQPDIIQSYYVGTTLTMRLALGRSSPIPRVFRVPGALHLEHLFYRRAEIATAGPLDYWIGTCHWIAERYRRSGIAPERIFVFHSGVDLDAYACPQRGKLRGELGVAETMKLVGMVGVMYAPKRLLGQTRGLKGHEDLIDALAICLRREPSIMGVFIGGAWDNATAYEHRVRAYAREQCGDRVVFLGTRNDVAALVPDLDVAVQPSHSEGLPASAIEAQLLGVPLVATHVAGLPDLIRHGETGWLVPPHNPARLAEAILEALQDPERARTMVCAGRERAAQFFNSAENIQQLLDIYRTILSGRRHHVRTRQ